MVCLLRRFKILFRLCFRLRSSFAAADFGNMPRFLTVVAGAVLEVALIGVMLPSASVTPVLSWRRLERSNVTTSSTFFLFGRNCLYGGARHGLLELFGVAFHSLGCMC